MGLMIVARNLSEYEASIWAAVKPKTKPEVPMVNSNQQNRPIGWKVPTKGTKVGIGAMPPMPTAPMPEETSGPLIVPMRVTTGDSTTVINVGADGVLLTFGQFQRSH